MKNKVVRYKTVVLFGLFFCLSGCVKDADSKVLNLQKGEEFYQSGIHANQNSRYEEATIYLKQAEQFLLKADTTPLLGLTWFYMGNSFESEMLYDIAREYYAKALPVLERGDNILYKTCVCRDLARTIALTNGNKDSVLLFFEKAEHYARQMESELLLLDIRAYRYQLCFPDSVEQRLSVCRRLAEQFGAHARYSEIVELLLAQHATDSAAYYLRQLHPADSAYAYWFEQSHAYFQSKVLRQRGQADKAYAILLDLYDRKIDELQRDAGARTYALSLYYDVAREQQLAQEAQREKEWQRTVSVILVLLLAITIALSFVLWRYWQQRRREQASQIQALRNKYTQQLELALERLQQKVNLTREMELQRMRGNEPEFPKWLQTYRDEKLVMNKESLDELISSIDKALDGAISRLRKAYPDLTESDMQFAILSIIGASDNDMSIVLNVQKQTIYHRRQIVRKHVDSRIEDIDAWLKDFVLN